MSDNEFETLKASRLMLACFRYRSFQEAVEFLTRERDAAEKQMAELHSEVRAERDARKETL